MSFVKSILQQWRERNLKKSGYNEATLLPPDQIPGETLAEQHLIEALAQQINEAISSGETITTLNVENVYTQLEESLSRYRHEARNTARNEISEKWSEEESRRIAEIKSLQEQNQELTHHLDEAQKRCLSSERLRKTLSERIHDLENQLIAAQKEHERDIEEKLRQINKIKAVSMGIVYDEYGEKISETETETEEPTYGEAVTNNETEEEIVFDCNTVDDDKTDDAIVIKHRYASLYAKLNKAQNTLQALRKENRIIMKRDTRHQQRIKTLLETVQQQRKEIRQLTSELAQTSPINKEKCSTTRLGKTLPDALSPLIFEDETEVSSQE